MKLSKEDRLHSLLARAAAIRNGTFPRPGTDDIKSGFVNADDLHAVQLWDCGLALGLAMVTFTDPNTITQDIEIYRENIERAALYYAEQTLRKLHTDDTRGNSNPMAKRQ